MEARITHTGLSVVALALLFSSATACADVVAVVSSKRPMLLLSKIQIADIFLGRSARFPDGSPAVPIDQSEASVLRDEFYLKVAGKSAAQMKALWSKIIFTGRGQPPKMVSSSDEVKKLISESPAAIGYIDKSAADGSVRVVF